MFFFFNVYSISTSSSSSLSKSITRSGSFLMTDSVQGSTSSLAASAIAAFKRSKPELSGFPGLKHAILSSSLSSSCINKAQQRNDLIIITLSRSDQGFKIHWATCFNGGLLRITSLGMCAGPLVHPLVVHFSQLIFYRLVPWNFCCLIM